VLGPADAVEDAGELFEAQLAGAAGPVAEGGEPYGSRRGGMAGDDTIGHGWPACRDTVNTTRA
jgi:hypothetical protein